jgi:hypothetical protein
MRQVTDAEKNDIWEQVRKEFPEDATMQQVHYVRLLHFRQMEGMTPAQRLRFYREPGHKKQPA